MTIYDKVKQLLLDSYSARERKFRTKALRELALQELGLEKQMFIGPEDLDKFGPLFETLTRAWRKVTKDNSDLRGSDYEEKTALEQEKVLELGYEIGYVPSNW